MKYAKIQEGIFLERPNRFVARVLVKDREERVHVKNTGRCKELLMEGVKVFLEDRRESPAPRKTRYSLIAVEKNDSDGMSVGRLVNIDSQAPNRVVGEALAEAAIELPGLEFPLTRIKPEAVFGASRFDFYVEDKAGKKAFLEVKGVTLEEGGVVRFPDAPTLRGVKHVNELCQAVEQGFSSFVIFVIQMEGVSFFEPNDATHPAFGEVLREARRKGVSVLAYDCRVMPGSMEIGAPVPVRLQRI